MESGGEDVGDGEPPVCCAEEFVTLVAEFPAAVTSVSAVKRRATFKQWSNKEQTSSYISWKWEDK